MTKEIKSYSVLAGIFVAFLVMSASGSYAQNRDNDKQHIQDEPKLEGSASGESFTRYGEADNVIRGEIVHVDEKSQKVTVRDTARAVHITTRVADKSTLGSFAPGDRVRVSFSSPDRSTATYIVAEEDWE